MQLEFEFEKETKGTLRFKEKADEPVIGTLYVKKSSLKELGISEKDVLVIDIRKEK